MMTLLINFLIVVVIAIIGVGVSILWRTCIYTRGSIFRFVGRLLDYWVFKACLPTATFWHKILRFIAYPLGRCIYCSSIHIGYNIFFLINYQFQLDLGIKWLIVLIPLTHLFALFIVKSAINGNSDMKVSDWHYLDNTIEKIFDLRRRASAWKPKNGETVSPLTAQDEKDLESCKSGVAHNDDWKTSTMV